LAIELRIDLETSNSLSGDILRRNFFTSIKSVMGKVFVEKKNRGHTRGKADTAEPVFHRSR